MQYARFGNTSMSVSRLCLGTMGFGGRHLDERACAGVLHEALDHGVNFIDTAEGYGPSEGILGRILGNRRDDVFIATKAYSPHTRDGRCGRNGRHNLIRSCEDSLTRLATDCIDIYMLHHPDPETPIEETLSALDDLQRQGKIRYVGCSNHYAWQLAHMQGVAACHGWPQLVTNEVCYNLLDRPLETECAPFCAKFNIPIMAYSPLCGGLLTGKYARGEALPAGSGIADRFGGKIRHLHETAAVHDALDTLKTIATEQDVSLIQLSLLWLMAKPWVGTTIVGGTRPEHFKPAYEIADRALPADAVARMDEASERQVYKQFRNQPCTDAPAVKPGHP